MDDKRLTFRNILGNSKYTGADSEGFSEPADYKLVIDRIAKLLENQFDFKFIDGIESTDQFILNVSINNIKHQLSVKSSSDWFDRNLVEQINDILKSVDTSKELLFIEPYGVENSDQGFSIAYLDLKTSSKLDYYGFLSKSDWRPWKDQRVTDFNDMFEDLIVL